MSRKDVSMDPDGVLTLYQYSNQGQLDYTVVDLDQDGVIDWSGTDRISRTAETYTTYDGKYVRQSTNTVHTTNNSSTTAVVGLTRVSTDGLKSWSSVFRDGSTAVTTTNAVLFHRPSGARTNTVYLPDGSRTESVYSCGRLQSVTRKDSSGGQVTRTSYTYDAHGRVYAVTDARNGTAFTSYNPADQPVFATTPDPSDGPGPQTTQTFYDTSGRTIGQWLPDGATTTNEYHPSGLLKKTWGARQYPVEYAYDAQGRMRTMKTWQGFTADSGTATTRWNYDTNRGWLQSKDYPDAATGQPPGTEGTGGPVYTYKPSGRMETRIWKRGVTTTYAYATGGDLSTVTYSGGVSTPSTTYTYDRRGRRLTALRNSITTTFAYNDANLLLSETHAGGTLANLSTVRAYDTSLRPQTAQIKNGANTLQEVSYAYDTAGRLQTVTDASATAYTATYGYPTNSPLIDTVIFKQNSTNRLVTTRTYDRLNRLTSIRSTAYGTGALALPVVFDYTYNPANQRTRMNLADGAYWVYQYDVLGQVISGRNQTAGAGRSRPTSSSFTIWPGRRGAGT